MAIAVNYGIFCFVFQKVRAIKFAIIHYFRNMPKGKTSSLLSKINSIIARFPKEFEKTPAPQLYCNICSCVVQCDKQFLVDRHRQTAKHQKGLSSPSTTSPSPQSFLQISSKNFTERVTRAFLSAEIPLKKLQNKELKELFKDLGKTLPSESSCRKKVEEMGEMEMNRVKNLVNGQKIFLAADESDISGTKYLNILVGLLDKPEQTYLIACKVLPGPPTAQSICQEIDDLLQFLNVARNDFCLLLSDAARYMEAAGHTLKSLYSQLFHVTCVAHLLHNCALRVKAKFPAVDNLIACVKAATIKNKTRQAMFASIGKPPQPVITRWASWLQAAFYYAENLPAVKNIVCGFEGAGLLVERAKASVIVDGLPRDLMKIKMEYNCLADLVLKTEETKYTIQAAHGDLTNLDFGDDSCDIASYITKKLKKNDLMDIIEMNREEIAPAVYGMLQKCQPTTASVERSFSMLNKLLAKDRNFLPQNVKHYMCVHYNLSTR